VIKELSTTDDLATLENRYLYDLPNLGIAIQSAKDWYPPQIKAEEERKAVDATSDRLEKVKEQMKEIEEIEKKVQERLTAYKEKKQGSA
jgi:hypothetical protein